MSSMAPLSQSHQSNIYRNRFNFGNKTARQTDSPHFLNQSGRYYTHLLGIGLTCRQQAKERQLSSLRPLSLPPPVLESRQSRRNPDQRDMKSLPPSFLGSSGKFFSPQHIEKRRRLSSSSRWGWRLARSCRTAIARRSSRRNRRSINATG